MSRIPQTVAFVAPIINCIQLLPQLIKTIEIKKVDDLSLGSLLLILFTNLLWFLHGYFIYDVPLIIAGIISLVINSALLVLYLKYQSVESI